MTHNEVNENPSRAATAKPKEADITMEKVMVLVVVDGKEDGRVLANFGTVEQGDTEPTASHVDEMTRVAF